MKTFRDLKIGDHVTRNIGSHQEGLPDVKIQMVVMDVTDKTLVCAAPGTEDWPLEELWTFDRDTGVEEDEELGWGVKFGVTGSYLQVEGAH